jgi:hypothetical protein
MPDKLELTPHIVIQVNPQNPAASELQITHSNGSSNVVPYNFAPDRPIYFENRELNARFVDQNGVEGSQIEQFLSTGDLSTMGMPPVRSHYETFTRGIDVVRPDDPTTSVTISGIGMGIDDKRTLRFSPPANNDNDNQSIGEFLTDRGISPLQGQEFKSDGTSYQYTDHSPKGAYARHIVDEKVEKTQAAALLQIPAIVPTNPQAGEYEGVVFRDNGVGFISYELPTHINMLDVARISIDQGMPVTGDTHGLYDLYTYNTGRAIGALQGEHRIHTELHVGNLELDVSPGGQNLPIIKDWGNLQDVSQFDNSQVVRGGLTVQQIALATDVSMYLLSTFHAYIRAARERGQIVNVDAVAPRLLANALGGYQDANNPQFSTSDIDAYAIDLQRELELLPDIQDVSKKVKKIADRFAIDIVKKVHAIE